MERYKTKERYTKAYEMYKSGMLISDISDKIGRSPGNIYKYFSRFGFKLDDRYRTSGLNKGNLYHEIEWILDHVPPGEPAYIENVAPYSSLYFNVQSTVRKIANRRGWIISTRMKGKFKHKQPVMIVTKEAIGL
jgi:hypothetical protein